MTSIFGSDRQARKNLPIFTFLTGYFPKGIVELVKVAVAGNVQHNPELAPTDIKWTRGKSTDQLDTAFRHMFDHKLTGPFDEEPPEVQKIIGGNTRHLAKAAWRTLAELELSIEADVNQETQQRMWEIANEMSGRAAYIRKREFRQGCEKPPIPVTGEWTFADDFPK